MYPDTIINTPFGSPISSRRAGVTQVGLSQGRVIPNGMLPASLFGVEKASIHLLMMFVHAVSASHRRRAFKNGSELLPTKTSSRKVVCWSVFMGLHEKDCIVRSHEAIICFRYFDPTYTAPIYCLVIVFSECAPSTPRSSRWSAIRFVIHFYLVLGYCGFAPHVIRFFFCDENLVRRLCSYAKSWDQCELSESGGPDM